MKVAVADGQDLLGPDVELGESVNLELVQLDPVLVRPQVKAHGDELDDDLFDEVEDRADEDGNEDLVHRSLPRPDGPVAVEVVVRHRRDERDLDGEPPQE